MKEQPSTIDANTIINQVAFRSFWKDIASVAIAVSIGLLVGSWVATTILGNCLRDERAVSRQLGADLQELRASVAAGLRVELQ